MPNKNYIHSYNLENDVVHLLEKNGYHAQRGAGSHKIDVIAFAPTSRPSWEFGIDNPAPIWISCKYGSARESPKSKQMLKEKADRYLCFPVIASRQKGKRIVFKSLNDVVWKPTKYKVKC